MLEVLIIWSYMFMVCLSAGVLIITAAGRLLPRQTGSSVRPGVTASVIVGTAAVTVYAEYLSTFMKVGSFCHILMLIVIAASLFFVTTSRSLLSAYIKDLLSYLRTREFFIYLFLILALAFFTSRGFFHTDTSIYHAQAIRVIEEYGSVIGIGNVQLHFAYNSSSLVFAALFTMSWLLPEAFHGTSGFIMTVLSLYAVYGILQTIRGIKKTADGRMAVLSASGRAAILFYVLTNAYYAMSPATDYMTCLGILFLLTEWLEGIEQKRSSEYYGWLCVYAVFCVSMKLSAATIILLTVYPLLRLLKERKYRTIFVFLGAGVFTILPYLIRNVILSGWLLYPLSSIDLFDVDWKIPASLLDNDSAQIEVWAKCLCDVSKQGCSLAEWFPVWWNGQQNHEQMLMYAELLAAVILCFILARKLLRDRASIRGEKICLYLTILVSLLFWFFKAPFIRYGLCYLLILPALAIGEFLLDFHRSGRFLLACTGLCSAGILFFLSYWVDAYFTLNMVFVKHYIASPYYISQQPFDDPEEEAVDLGNGVTVYYSVDGENNSYYCTPSSCYKSMVEETTARGSSVRDGFRHK